MTTTLIIYACICGYDRGLPRAVDKEASGPALAADERKRNTICVPRSPPSRGITEDLCRPRSELQIYLSIAIVAVTTTVTIAEIPTTFHVRKDIVKLVTCVSASL